MITRDFWLKRTKSEVVKVSSSHLNLWF